MQVRLAGCITTCAKGYRKYDLLNRREFLSLAGSVALFAARRSEPARSLRLGLLVRRGNDVANGAILAGVEAERAAALFGQSIRLDVGTARTVIANGATVLIGGVSPGDCVTLARVADENGILFFNVGSSADSLRRDQCRPNMFHVMASDAMLSSARASSGSSGDASLSMELWHSSLEKYGGAQLNDRYRARFGKTMTSNAWAGWVAVKIAWEASLRAQSTMGKDLREFLVKDASQFDGHKGAPLSFRSWDHQLRQPLYAVSNGRVIAELPDVGKFTGESIREELDKYGDRRISRPCGQSFR